MTALDESADTFMAAMHALWIRVVGFLPDVLAALLIVAIGYVVSRLAAAAVVRIAAAAGLDRFCATNGITSALARAGIERPMSQILMRFVFWVLMLVFFVNAIDRIGLVQVSATLNSFVMYLPRVIGATLILMVGLFVARFVRGVIEGTAETMAIDFARPLGTAAYVLLIIIAASLAIGQLQLETEILYDVISITLMSAGAAAAIAFGLGAKEVAANVLAGTYVREMFSEGDRIHFADIEGEIRYVGPVKTVIHAADGEISVANSELVRTTVRRKH
jgi:small-conductance mechanosensitive channel